MAPLLAPVISDLQCFLISSNLIRVERNRFNPSDPPSSWSSRSSQTHESFVCHWKPSNLLTNCLRMAQVVRHGSIRSFRKAFQCMLGSRCVLSKQETPTHLAQLTLRPMNLSGPLLSLSNNCWSCPPLWASRLLFSSALDVRQVKGHVGDAASWLDGLSSWWRNNPHTGSHNT